MIYTGKHIDAQTALRYGLVNRVVPAEALLDEAKALMDDILKVSPMAIKYAKLSINKGSRYGFDECFGGREGLGWALLRN